MNLRIISAGAGSGKTYRLTNDLVELLQSGDVRPAGIIATTFTKKAAAELQERVRTKLLESGLREQADELNNALIGTVHGLGVKLLKRFAYEAGVSPEVSIIADEDRQILFNQSLSQVLTNERVHEMERLAERLGFNKNPRYKTDWRQLLRTLTEIARNNDFDEATLDRSRRESFSTFRELLSEPTERTAEEWNQRLRSELEAAIERIENNPDETKGTRTAVSNLRSMATQLDNLGQLPWYDWVKIGKTKVGAKSRDDFEPLKTFVRTHDTHTGFHADVEKMVDNLFQLAQDALREYQNYKRERGLIDYTDMEALVRDLLKNERVQQILGEELDLLMVDEFQDTSPLQLEIFWQLTRFAKQSIWVGDPKQSIYGFRGAEPELMRAVVDYVYPEGIPAANINTTSYRSRRDIVHATNAIFTKAFSELPAAQVQLEVDRMPETGGVARQPEPSEMPPPLHHWHALMEGEKPRYNKTWTHGALAERTAELVRQAPIIFDKEQRIYRPLHPGDIAILCRSNRSCAAVAEALDRSGLAVAMSRNGLLETKEVLFIHACLKFILNRGDSLSVATILLLSNRMDLSEIIETRLDYLEARAAAEGPIEKWAASDPFIQQLNELRQRTEEYSSAEILNLLLEELDLRRIIAAWGQAEHRLANVDRLRALVLQYEENCNRLHTAASLAGFLLYLNKIQYDGDDQQASGEGVDAVNVLTYHRSKGLEWPVVICYDLNESLRERTLDFSLMSDRTELDPEDILGGRWLRLWLNPYSDQLGGTGLEEALEHHPAKAEAVKKAAAEEVRLLYVGLTRARDLLVFPTTPKDQAGWLNRVWSGNEKQPTLDAHTSHTPWEWEGRLLPIETDYRTYAASFAGVEKRVENPLFVESRPIHGAHPALRIDPDETRWIKATTHRVVNTWTYATEVPAAESPEDDQHAARALKQFLAADFPHYPTDRRSEIAEGLLERHQVGEELDAAGLLRRSEAFHQFLESTYPQHTAERHVRLRTPVGQHLFETYLDVVLKMEDRVVLVQHSSFSGTGKQAPKRIKNLRAWLRFSREGLQKLYPNRRVETAIHFPFTGQILVVETSAKKEAARVDERQMRLSL